MATHQSILTLTLDFFLSSEVATTWQTDGVAHKLKPTQVHLSLSLFCRLPPWCVKIADGGLNFYFRFLFYFIFIFRLFSIFRTT